MSPLSLLTTRATSKGMADAVEADPSRRGPLPRWAEYITALCENYLLFPADRYDIKRKAYLKTLEKYYLGDPGSGLEVPLQIRGDLGHRVKTSSTSSPRRYRFAYRQVGTTSRLRPGSQWLIYLLPGFAECHGRYPHPQLRPLKTIGDNHPKTLLTMDRGVTSASQVNILDWLLGE